MGEFQLKNQILKGTSQASSPIVKCSNSIYCIRRGHKAFLQRLNMTKPNGTCISTRTKDPRLWLKDSIQRVKKILKDLKGKRLKILDVVIISKKDVISSENEDNYQQAETPCMYAWVRKVTVVEIQVVWNVLMTMNYQNPPNNYIDFEISKIYRSQSFSSGKKENLCPVKTLPRT